RAVLLTVDPQDLAALGVIGGGRALLARHHLHRVTDLQLLHDLLTPGWGAVLMAAPPSSILWTRPARTLRPASVRPLSHAYRATGSPVTGRQGRASDAWARPGGRIPRRYTLRALPGR